MPDDSPYWGKDEDELTDAERAQRLDDLEWERYRAYSERQSKADPAVIEGVLRYLRNDEYVVPVQKRGFLARFFGKNAR